MQLWMAIVISILMIWVEHWFPWNLIPIVKGKDLPRLAAYVLGVLALAGPLTGLFLSQGNSQAVWEMWVVISAAGGATFLAWFVDWVLILIAKKTEAEERELALIEDQDSHGAR